MRHMDGARGWIARHNPLRGYAVSVPTEQADPAGAELYAIGVECYGVRVTIMVEDAAILPRVKNVLPPRSRIWTLDEPEIGELLEHEQRQLRRAMQAMGAEFDGSADSEQPFDPSELVHQFTIRTRESGLYTINTY